MFQKKSTSSSVTHSSHHHLQPRYVTSKISGGQKSVYYINDNHPHHPYYISNSLLFRPVFLRYLKKRRPMLVVLLCVLLMSLSYLFVISGGLQFKHPTNYGQDRVINNVFSINNRLRQEELLNQEKVSLQYNKLARLNQSIKKVISYGKVSLLNNIEDDENVLKSSLSKSDNSADTSDIEKEIRSRGYRTWRRNGKGVNLDHISESNNESDIGFSNYKSEVYVKSPIKLGKLNYEDENHHSSQMTELTEIWKQANLVNNPTSQISGNGMDLSHLMNDLKDPEFQKRLTSMKTRQQEYIMTLLRRRGQLIELPDGGSIIITGPNLTSFTIPLSLKKKPVEYWTANEQIWLNITYYPWPNDEMCENFTTVFSKGQPLPPVALASNPNSGNTWLRYLIEGITGIFTGSFYSDIDLSRKGYYGESLPFDSGLTSVIKAHGSTTNEGTTRDQMEQTDGNAILLIRNPYKAIYGHRHLDAGGHVGYADASHFVGPGWDHFVSAKIQMWEEFHLTWLEEGNDIMIIIFEQLTKIDFLNQTLEKISEFLNFEFDENRLSCTVKHSEGRFHRKQKCIRRKRLPANRVMNVANKDIIPSIVFNSSIENDTANDIFTNQQKGKINLAIRNVNEAINKRGLTPLPLSDYENTVIRLNLCP